MPVSRAIAFPEYRDAAAICRNSGSQSLFAEIPERSRSLQDFRNDEADPCRPEDFLSAA